MTKKIDFSVDNINVGAAPVPAWPFDNCAVMVDSEPNAEWIEREIRELREDVMTWELSGLTYDDMSATLEIMVEDGEIYDFEIDILEGHPETQVTIWTSLDESYALVLDRTLDDEDFFEDELGDSISIFDEIQERATKYTRDEFNTYLMNLMAEGTIWDFDTAELETDPASQLTHEIYIQETSWDEFKLLTITLKAE